MIEIKNKKDCCGCWACENVCPKQCIRMEEDEEGFRYPRIDVEACINCALCEKTCPVLNAKDEDIPHQQEGWLVQHKDDGIRQESTSGGAFTAIASWVIRQEGVVFGAGYRKGTFTVVHQAVEHEEDLAIFRNSKYVQSEIGDSFRQVADYLKTGKLVLFSGTPCQIEGLLGFLRGKTYDNLILLDLICRGVPSPKVLDSYIGVQRQHIGGEFRNVLFRDKYYGYHYSSFSIYNHYKDKDYHKGVDTNAYLRAFFNNLSDRPSCYDCHFKKRYRRSDLTLWDCFPIEKFTKELDGKGTTRVLIQSEKGEQVMNAVMSSFRAVAIAPDQLTAGVREMFHSVPINPKRSQFFTDFGTMEPEAFFEKWFPVTWKVRLNAFVRLTCVYDGIYTKGRKTYCLEIESCYL